MPAGVVAFWSLSLVLAITPGADWAYAISAGLRYRAVTPSVGGLLLGHLAATVVVAVGVAALLARSSLIMTGLTLTGAVYLIWLGINTLARTSTRRAEDGPADPSWVRQTAKGFGIGAAMTVIGMILLVDHLI